MEKIYQVYVEENGYVATAIPCASLDVAKRVLNEKRTKALADWSSKNKNYDIRKNDDEHFRIVDRFADESYDLVIECAEIIK